MEREVGEEFFSGFNATSYVVQESETEKCEGCAFFSECTEFESGCTKVESAGYCSQANRSDGKNVIFKKVWREK